MKKLVALLLAVVMCFSFAACGGEEKVSDIEVNGEQYTVTDFLIEHLREYTSTEEFARRENQFADQFGAPETPFTVTRAIELEVDGLGQSNMSIHYLLVKADWWYCTDDGNGNDNILIVVNYDTGEVLDQFMADESWMADTESLNYWNYIMLNGALVGSGYDGGVIVIDSETRTELSEKEIAKINDAIHNPEQENTPAVGKDTETKDSVVKETESGEVRDENGILVLNKEEAQKYIRKVTLTVDDWGKYFANVSEPYHTEKTNEFGDVVEKRDAIYHYVAFSAEDCDVAEFNGVAFKFSRYIDYTWAGDDENGVAEYRCWERIINEDGTAKLAIYPLGVEPAVTDWGEIDPPTEGYYTLSQSAIEDKYWGTKHYFDCLGVIGEIYLLDLPDEMWTKVAKERTDTYYWPESLLQEGLEIGEVEVVRVGDVSFFRHHNVTKYLRDILEP